MCESGGTWLHLEGMLVGSGQCLLQRGGSVFAAQAHTGYTWHILAHLQDRLACVRLFGGAWVAPWLFPPGSLPDAGLA